VVEKVVRIRVCNLPDCPTPEDEVKRVEISIEKTTFQVDLCETHRAPVDDLAEYAHKRRRRRGIQVVSPDEIPRGRRP
jgi:hypothetical protein